MSQPDNSGSAFPVSDALMPGMTLRDYFAAKAMMVVNHSVAASGKSIYPDTFAKSCYELAEAMLKERAK